MQKMAATDEEFRRELLENTDEAIEKIAGEKLPEGFQVKVIENDPAYSATFVLPSMASDELDDDELESVAGGFCLVDATNCRALVGSANPERGMCQLVTNFEK